METIRVTVLGAAVQESISKVANGRVAGVTSKGAFLRADDRILFLTAAEYRSPFNLTLYSVDHLFSALQPGDTFDLIGNNIVFSGRGFSLITSGAEVWQPPQPARLVFSVEEQRDRADPLIDEIRRIDDEKGFLFLARPLDEIMAEYQRELHQAATRLARSFRAGDKETFMSSARKLLGAGGGLTPSGDDFLTGFFLYHFRHLQAGASEPEQLKDWWAELTGLAFEKTTTISANRLEYAARGWSEELFLKLIDHLFNPGVDFSYQQALHLLEFGHSSGVDTLMGISYALDSLLE